MCFKTIGLAYSWKEITVFALFYFVFEGKFHVQAPGGAYIWRGDLTEGFWVTSLGGLYTEGFIFRILQYMQKNLNITKPRHSKQILPVHWPFAIVRFHSKQKASHCLVNHKIIKVDFRNDAINY